MRITMKYTSSGDTSDRRKYDKAEGSPLTGTILMIVTSSRGSHYAVYSCVSNSGDSYLDTVLTMSVIASMEDAIAEKE